MMAQYMLEIFTAEKTVLLETTCVIAAEHKLVAFNCESIVVTV